MTITVTLLAALGAVALMMVGLGIKILVRKHGEFKRHCSSMDPYTGERPGCVCGIKETKGKLKERVGEGQNSCKNRFHPLEVNEALMDEAGVK